MSAHVHSPSTPTSTPAVPAEATSKTPPASPEVVASPVPLAAPEAPPRSLVLFTIALAIAGTLPIGLGIGVAYRATLVAPAETATNSAHNECLVHDHTASVHEMWRNRQQADDRFRAGEFRLALQTYQSNETAESLRQSEEVSFKIAFCREALGQWNEALVTYRALSSRDDSEFRPAALLAQGRLWLTRHDSRQARAVLGQLLQETDEARQIPPAIAQDARFYFAIACLPEEAATGTTLETVHPISPLSALAWKGFQPFDSDNQVGGASPDSAALDPSDVLSAIVDPSQGEQFLQRLLVSAPQHRLAGHAKLAWGHFAYQRGDLATAAARYEEAIRKSSDTVSLIAAYNRGVVQFQRGDYRATSAALGRVIDGAPGHELSIPALILRGRAGLELGNGEQAAFDLKRAADLACNDDERAWATVLMGMAYLQAHKPKLAAETLFQRRDRVSTDPARTAAAFVVALARFESLESAETRERETLFLLRALANLDHNTAWLGSCGRTLIGRAYRQLGLGEQMAQIYSQALSNHVCEPLASEMKLALAEHALASGDESQSLALLAELRATQQVPWSVAASTRTAEWELSHDHGRECLAICQELLLLQDVDHAPILRLMGAAYERAGEHAKAAECYAGLAPQ